MRQGDFEGQGPRFVREAPEENSHGDVTAAELLDRLESRGEELARTRARLDSMERVLTAERKERKRVTGLLKDERRLREQQGEGNLEGEVAHQRAARMAAERELEGCRRNLTALEHRFNLARAQLTALDEELSMVTRPLWRKLLRRPPKGD